ELEFLPADETLLDAHLVHRRQPQRVFHEELKRTERSRGAAARAAERERRPYDDGESHLFEDRFGLGERARHAALGGKGPGLPHRRIEELAALGAADRIDPRADQLDAVALQDAGLVQLQR